MNISLNWLSDYVTLGAVSAEKLAEIAMLIGFPCEGIEYTDSDVVLDLEITSNRPDLLGHVGVARELAAAAGLEFRPPQISPLPTAGKAAQLTSVQVQDTDLCPRYTARVLRNVKVGPSPKWLVERLEAVGMRSINNVVDVTNYVLMEYSQPLHSFDYDKLAEHRIVVRRAVAGETLLSIDQTRCKLEDWMLVIADADKPVAIAGVMGGLDTEVGEATCNVLLESARFDPLNTRKTSRKLGIMTASNYRFERGVDPVAVDEASLRACQLILDLAGGELAEGVVDVWPGGYEPREVTLRPQRTDALLGLSVPPQRQAQILERLGLSPHSEGGRIVCKVPSYRPDLSREADLIEEVARIEGYDRIPVHDRIAEQIVPEPQADRIRRRLVEALSAAGYDEALTPAFIDASEAERFGFGTCVCVDRLHRKTHNALRPTLLPSLLNVCKTNQDAGNGDVSLYELAAVFPPGGEGGLPAEYKQLGMVTTGELRSLRGALEALVQRASVDAEVAVEPAELPGFAQAARVRVAGQEAGLLGVLSPAVLDAYGLERPIAAAALRYEAIEAPAAQLKTYSPLPKFPPVRRDLSLIVDEALTWRELSDAIAELPQPLRTAVEYVTTFRGKPIAADRKSVTVRLTYRSSEGTLRGEQVDEAVAQLVSHVKGKLGAELRA